MAISQPTVVFESSSFQVAEFAFSVLLQDVLRTGAVIPWQTGTAFSTLHSLNCSVVLLLLKNLTWYSGIPRFTVPHLLRFTDFCLLFYKLKVRPSTGKKDYSSFYCDT